MRAKKLSESEIVIQPNPTSKVFRDLKGHVFGRLTVIGFAGRETRGKQKESKWFCRCECGSFVKVHGGSLRAGHSKSCGCLSSEVSSERNTKHGDLKAYKRHYLYTTRRSILFRCHNPKNKDYVRYGERGITLFEEWRASYVAFRDYVLSTLGDRPENHQLDRIDNDRGYEPGNLRWATPSQNSSNRRDTKFMTIRGVTKSRPEWASVPGAANLDRITQRILKGWSDEEAVFGRKAANLLPAT